METEPRYLLADHSRGVDSGESEVHVGGDHGGVVLVLRLETACSVPVNYLSLSFYILILPDLAPVPGANLVSKLTFKPGTNWKR